MNARARRWPRMVFGVWAVLLLLVAGEITVRYYDREYNPNVFDHIRQGAPSLRGFGPVWYEGEHHEFIRDSRERRHPFATDKFRIVCLGGSTTHGQPNNDYPGFLGEELPDTDVINAGFAAYATVHTIATLADNALAWKPNVVIVNHAINDQAASYYPSGWRPDLEHKYMNWAPAGEMRRFVTPLNVFFQNSHLYWGLTRFPRRVEVWWRFGSWRGNKPLSYKANIVPRSYGPTPPHEALQQFATNMETIVRIGQGRTRLVLITQAYNESARAWDDTFSQPLKWKEAGYVPPAPEEMAAHHRIYNQVVRDVGTRMGVQVIDAEPVITDPGLFLDSVHLNADGNKALATLVRKGLEPLQ